MSTKTRECSTEIGNRYLQGRPPVTLLEIFHWIVCLFLQVSTSSVSSGKEIVAQIASEEDLIETCRALGGHQKPPPLQPRPPLARVSRGSPGPESRKSPRESFTGPSVQGVQNVSPLSLTGQVWRKHRFGEPSPL